MSSKKPSLFAQHLTLLGHAPEARGPLDAATQREKERIAGLTLAPLDLPSGNARAPEPRQALSRSTRLVAALAIAAGLSLVIRYRQAHEVDDPRGGLRFKGESKVWVYWERGGEVHQLEPGVALQNGDRVRAEVLATEDLVGYLAVESGKGDLLGGPDLVRDSALRLKAGEKGTFAGAIKLVGANEDERLVVILCAADAEPTDFQDLPEGCGSQEFPLRGLNHN